MESVVAWAAEVGHRIEPYGLDISEGSPRLPSGVCHNGGIGSSSATLCSGIRLLGSTSSEQSLSTFQTPPAVNILNDSLNVWWHRADGSVCSYGSSRPERARAEVLVL